MRELKANATRVSLFEVFKYGADGRRVLGNARIAGLSDMEDPREVVPLISSIRNSKARRLELIHMTFAEASADDFF
jgi:hypothetical protein